MIKSELIQKLAYEHPHLFHKDVERIVNVVFDEIIAAMARGDRVELRGFGAFSVKHRASRTARNPRTGQAGLRQGKIRAVLQDRQGFARAAEPAGARAGRRGAASCQRPSGPPDGAVQPRPRHSGPDEDVERVGRSCASFSGSCWP